MNMGSLFSWNSPSTWTPALPLQPKVLCTLHLPETPASPGYIVPESLCHLSWAPLSCPYQLFPSRNTLDVTSILRSNTFLPLFWNKVSKKTRFSFANWPHTLFTGVLHIWDLLWVFLLFFPSSVLANYFKNSNLSFLSIWGKMERW